MAAFPLLILLGSVVLGFSVTALFTHLLSRIARRVELLDRPTQARNAHLKATPTSGGLAIAAGVVAGTAVLYGAWNHFPEAFQALPFWGGAFLMLGAGFWDDKYTLDPKSKFFLQLVAAFLLLHAGIYLQPPDFLFPNETHFGGGLYGIPLSIIWIVGIINAVNLIDGLDGLATGIVGTAFFACAVIFGVKGHPELMIVGIAMAGAIIGFLPHNFKPASIFMGDSGSLFLGYLLAAYTLQTPLHPDPLMALLILPVLLGVPVLDTGTAILRRAASKGAVCAPDDRHIHHRLWEKTSERQAVLTLYGVGTWFGSAAVLISILPVAWGYILAGMTTTVAFLWAWQLGCLSPARVKQGSEKKELSSPLESLPSVEPPVGGDGAWSEAASPEPTSDRKEEKNPTVSPQV